MPDTDYTARQGRYIVKQFQGETVRAFVPPALPPDPPIDLARFQILLEQANQAIGRLDGLASLLPDLSLLLYIYVRKEAVLSSQIEGAQSSLSDLCSMRAMRRRACPSRTCRRCRTTLRP